MYTAQYTITKNPERLLSCYKLQFEMRYKTTGTLQQLHATITEVETASELLETLILYRKGVIPRSVRPYNTRGTKLLIPFFLLAT